MMTLTRSGSSVRAVLSEELRTVDADALYRHLLAEIDADTSLAVDAAGVTRLDTSVAQIFVAVAARVRDVRLEAVSAEWAEAWRVLGLRAIPCVAPDAGDGVPSSLAASRKSAAIEDRSRVSDRG